MPDKMKAHITLYSKPGCHLCEKMKADIAKASCADLYELEEINIESDELLLAQYRHDIPVLLVNGREAFRHRLTSDSFRAYLAGKAG